MKKIYFNRLVSLFMVLLLGGLTTLYGTETTKYSKAVANASPDAAGKVYASKSTSYGTGDKTASATQSTKDKNDKATHTYYFKAETTDTGYSFEGWYDGSTFKTKSLTHNQSVETDQTNENSAKTIILTAKWTANKYDVSFDTQTEDVANPASQKATYASTYGSLPTLATRRFYTFDGWFTGKTDGTKVTPDTKVTIKDAQTLFAHWTLVPENQTLSWGESMQFNMAKGTRQAIAVSATSGLTDFSYQSDNEDVVAVDGEYLKAVAPGEANITVTQAGNTYFNSATLVAKFSVWSKETPIFTENGFSEDETKELKVGDAVTLNLTNVSDGLNGDFTVTAGTPDVIGIAREANTLNFTADHAGTTTVTVAQAENADIFAASKTYTFNVTRYEPVFTLSDNELELEETATLALENTDGVNISFVPSDIVSYDGSTGTITAAKVGTTTLTVSQPQTNSIAAKETQYTITVTKKTPSLTVKMNGSARTSLSIARGNTATVTFEKVSDAEVVVTPVSGTQYASYVNGTMTAGPKGTAIYRATLAETDTYQAKSVDFSLTVTDNTKHLPISGKSYTIGNGSATDWTHKYETFSFQGIPDKLSFNFAYIYVSDAGKPSLQAPDYWVLGDDNSRGRSNTHMLYVEESADGNSWATIWTDDNANSKDTKSSGEIQLSKSTRYLRFHHSCNFSNSYTNISISELKYLDTPDPETIDFGSAVINSGEVTKTSLVNWCNISPLTVTSSNPRFTISPSSFGNFEQSETQQLTVNYIHTNEAGINEGDITITNGSQIKTIHVTATTTKRPQTITWNAELAATGYAMNVGEQYPDSVITALASVTSGEHIIFTSDNSAAVEVIADTALRAVGIGTASITAYQAGDAEYAEVSSTKTFTVTDLRKQSITWNQNLYGLLTTSGSVELTATATSGGPITYTSANTGIVKVEGNVLTVVGEGETTITATQPGYTDENGIEWLAVSQDNYVIVRNPASQCNQMALSQGSLTLNGSKKQQDYNLTGIPATLTFTAKHGTKSGSWGTTPSYSALVVEQYLYKNGSFDWYEVYNKVVGTSDTHSGNISIDEAATKLRFRTLETGTDHTISNIRVTQKKLLRADITSINQETETNTAWQQTITVTHSNIDLMSVTTKQGLLTLSASTLGEGCGDYGDDDFTVSFTPRMKNQEYKDTIVITDGKAQPSTIEIPVRLVTKGLNQSINDFELPTEALTTAEIAVATTASSGLEVSFHSSDSTIAYVEEGSLKILKAGTVTITAKQEGDSKFDAAAPVSKTITLTLVPTTITAVPAAATIEYGQSLSASALTGGEGSVAGTFVWETPDTKPAAGTPSYNVVFVPEQNGIYATASTLVSLRVEKATPVVTTIPTASDITIAQGLSDSQLTGGEASVAGTFAWKNASENRLRPGTYERTVVFTPEDNSYNSVEISVSVNVINVLARINELPIVTNESLIYGVTLADVVLEGGSANVAGAFAWTDSTALLSSGTHAYAAQFVPEDLELYSIVSVKIDVTVAKADADVTTLPTASALVYGQPLSESQLTDFAVSVPGVYVWQNGDEVLAAGEYQRAVAFMPTDTNYNTIHADIAVSVNKAALTVTANAQETTYGAEAPANSVAYSGFVLSDNAETLNGDLAYDCTYTVGSPVGEYDIMPKGLSSDNYTIEYVAAKLTVGKAALTITAENKAVTYGDAAPEYTVSYEGFVNSETAETENVLDGELTFACEYAQGNGVGEYTITPSGLTAQNYTITYHAGTLTVNKAALTVTAENKEVVYGAEAPALTVAYDGWKGTDEPSVLTGNLVLSTDYEAGKGVGEYAITATGLEAANYEIAYVAGTLTVTAAAATAVPPTAVENLVYTGEAQTLIAAGTANGGEMQYRLDEEGEWSTELPTATLAGAYAVYYKVAADANHNDFVAVEAVHVEIAKADAELTVAPAAVAGLVYSGEAQTLVAAGEANNGTVLYSLDGENFAEALPTATEAGVYTVTYKVQGAANYNDVEAASVNVVIDYTIAYELNGGSVESENPTHYNAETADFTLVNPTKEHYTFAGWTGSNGEEPQTEVTIAQGATGNRTYTANWTVNKYTITWLNADESLIETTEVEYGAMPAHTDAEKAATAQYTYTFKGWTPALAAVTGNATYKAEFDSTVNVYTITFKNADGTELQKSQLAYGETPVYEGATPTKEADAQKTYAFAGWDADIVAVTGNATYTATFNSTVNKYTITWLNADESLIETTEVEYGAMPAHTDAEKAATAQYTYTFKGWTPALAAVTGNATYKAEFDSMVNVYTITFKNADGTELQKSQLAYGETPVYEGATPTKEADAQNTYAFAGWDAAIAAVTGNATYTAIFSSTVNKYTITWLNADESLIDATEVEYGAMPEHAAAEKAATAQYTYTFKGWTPALAEVTGAATYKAEFDSTVNVYTVIFQNADGTELQKSQLAYGETPVYEGATPTKEADAQNTYAFAGWDAAIAAVTGNATYTAIFSSTVNKYTITWLNADESLIETTEVEYGAMPEHAAAEKAATAQYTYTFKGWTPALAAVTGNATYKAEFDSVVNVYTVTFKNGEEVLQSSQVAYGETPVYEGATPTKEADEQYTYTFATWTPEIVAVTGEATYTATFNSQAKIVEKQNQIIVWEVESLGSIEVGDNTLYLDAYTAELAVYFTSSDSTIAYVDANDYVVALKPGEVTITARQDGNETYKAAEPVSKTLTVVAKENQGGHDATAVDDVQGDNVPCIKVLRGNQVFIIRDGRTYTAQGQLVN